jgi:hypothetical protein
MELLAPLALAAVGSYAATGMKVSSGGRSSNSGVRLIEKDSAPADANAMVFDNSSTIPMMSVQTEFDPVRAQFVANAQPNRQDNVPVLQTVERDPKYALTPQSGVDFQYDQMNRGSSELENQWYYSRLTKDSETPLSMGYLPEYKRSTGVMLRNPDTPDMLKRQKRELLEEEVWVAQPEPDRAHYDPITGELARRARQESKYAGGNGALNDFTMNDRPGSLAGPTKGYSTGLEPTRQFTGYHPRQRFFRVYDGQRQRNPHGLRAANKQSQQFEIRGELEGQYTNEKKTQLGDFQQIPVGDGGWKQPHLSAELRQVQLRATQRETVPSFEQGWSSHRLHPEGALQSQLASHVTPP